MPATRNSVAVPLGQDEQEFDQPSGGRKLGLRLRPQHKGNAFRGQEQANQHVCNEYQLKCNGKSYLTGRTSLSDRAAALRGASQLFGASSKRASRENKQATSVGPRSNK